MKGDLIQPFQLESSRLRGRFVRLGSVLEVILSRHDDPEPVARLTAETLVLAALLAGMLKYDGIFTLQVRGNGPVGLLVADVESSGAVRACARFDEEALAARKPGPVGARDLLGDGLLAFTVDQGAEQARYQGIVELDGDTMVDFATAYFHQSEQILTAFVIAVEKDPEEGWRAGGLMLQRLPEAGVTSTTSGGDDPDENWTRANTLMKSVTEKELTDPTLSPHDLLFRLFHEEGVRVFQPQALSDQCRCTTGRVMQALATLPPEEQEEIATDGPAEIRCGFCGRLYEISPHDIADLTTPPSQIH